MPASIDLRLRFGGVRSPRRADRPSKVKTDPARSKAKKANQTQSGKGPPGQMRRDASCPKVRCDRRGESGAQRRTRLCTQNQNGPSGRFSWLVLGPWRFSVDLKLNGRSGQASEIGLHFRFFRQPTQSSQHNWSACRESGRGRHVPAPQRRDVGRLTRDAKRELNPEGALN